MDKETLHLPDFTVPDFVQPALEQVDLELPGFILPDPQRSVLAELARALPVEGLDRLETDRPDPALPDLLEPGLPGSLARPDPQEHMMPSPVYEPGVVMRQRPGELDPAASEIMLHSPDREGLPPHISYPRLYTTEDEMSTRKRHLGMLELGLEQARGDER